MRILITGGAGFIGRNLITYLRRKTSYEIRVLDNFTTGERDHIDGMELTLIEGDIRDPDIVSTAVSGIDTVVHLAADTGVVSSVENPMVNLDINVNGTVNLLRASKESNVKAFIFASTGGAILGEVDPPVHERIVPRPISPYGASKLAGEAYCSAFSGAYGLRTVGLRFSNVYGPCSGHKGSVVAHFFNQVIHGAELLVYGNGEQTRDFVFVQDICDGILRSIQTSHTGVYQLGTGIPTTINGLIQLISETVGDLYEIKIRHTEVRSGEIQKSWCNISHASDQLGYRATTPIIEGLQVTWNWFKQQSGC